MGVYTGLTRFFGRDLCALAARLGYAEDNLCVLRGDIAELQRSFPETYQNILSCTHNRDQRTPIQYAQDVVASWLFEDYLVAAFHNRGRVLILTGRDAERKLLPGSRVSASADCAFHSNGRILSVEVMNSYTAFWRTKRRLHLRDDKYRQLQREQGVLLCVDTQSRTYAIVDFTREPPPASHIPSYGPYGGKPVYEVFLDNVRFAPFRIDDVIAALDATLR